MDLDLFKVFLRSFKKLLRLLSPAIIIIPGVIGKTFFRFRIGIMRTDRLGHLALNTDLFFRRLQLGVISNKYSYLLVAPNINSDLVANSYLLKMFKRYANTTSNIKIVTSSVFYFVITNSISILMKLGIFQELTYFSNEKDFSESNQTISFTREEIESGYSLLSELGIEKRNKVVCIFARDNAYLSAVDKSTDWAYHDYRNADINTYIDAIKYLIEQGYTVVRIGSVVNKPVEFKNKYFIDYSMSGKRTEFLDLFLISISHFVLGSTSGVTDVAEIFKVPFLAVNFAPCVGCPLGKHDLYIPKKYIDNDNNIISFKKALKIERSCLYDGVKLKKKYGYSYIDNTPDEIFWASKEMVERINNNFVGTDYDKKLLDKYFNEFWDKNPYSDVKTKVCSKWLRDNQGLYF